MRPALSQSSVVAISSQNILDAEKQISKFLASNKHCEDVFQVGKVENTADIPQISNCVFQVILKDSHQGKTEYVC